MPRLEFVRADVRRAAHNARITVGVGTSGCVDVSSGVKPEDAPQLRFKR